jgi:hypothetical protein
MKYRTDNDKPYFGPLASSQLELFGNRPELFGFYNERHAIAGPCKARPDIVARRNDRSLRK